MSADKIKAKSFALGPKQDFKITDTTQKSEITFHQERIEQIRQGLYKDKQGKNQARPKVTFGPNGGGFEFYA